MISMVKFILCVFYHNWKKRSTNSNEGRQFIPFHHLSKVCLWNFSIKKKIFHELEYFSIHKWVTQLISDT